jgi:hypothetical protein
MPISVSLTWVMGENKAHRRNYKHVRAAIFFDPFAGVNRVELLHDDHWHATYKGEVKQLYCTYGFPVNVSAQYSQG